MKNSKKGISLIVLVITIIVIIILAAAVLLSLQNNNPIDNANKATFQNDASEIKSSIALFLGNYMAKSNGVSPFLATGEITIGDTARTIAITAVDEKTAPENVLSWTDLGMSGKPASVATAKYNVATGKLTCTSTNTKLATAEN